MAQETVIALVGRTNVGKSTLFNRLTGKKEAIVHDMPGVTRDRKEGQGRLGDLSFKVIDTAGLEETSSLAKAMWKQTEKAIEQADVVLMVVDARSELTALDLRLATDLRRQKKPVLLLANKCEGGNQYLAAAETYRLGLGDPIAISGEHGLGMADLYQALQPFFPEDVISSAPVGSNIFALLVMYLLVTNLSRFFNAKPFVIIWYGFVLFSLVTFLSKWLLVSVYYSHFLPLAAVMFSYLMTAAVYPILSVINVFVQNRLMTDEV